mmetsp:Transcript_88383/g.175731  ORF Transcript_88383/g.175731 Transcript_88383/m.175731 type:complete len:404 (-) Transcript_88383:31-1242(-)
MAKRCKIDPLPAVAGAATLPSNDSSFCSHSWCESRNLAGCYVCDRTGEKRFVTLANYSDMVSLVRIDPPMGTSDVLFSVAGCNLHSWIEGAQFGPVLGRFRPFAAVMEWVAAAPWGEQVWHWTAPINGHSAAVQAAHDTVLLKALTEHPGGSRENHQPHDFCTDRFRDMTESEWQAALEACHVCGPNAAPRRERPRALLMLAPSAGGKTSLAPRFAGEFSMSLEGSVHADGGIFRSFHGQYAAAVEHGKVCGSMWYHVWPAAKSVVQMAKRKVIEAAMDGNQDLVISDTGSDLQKLLKLIRSLKDAGYEVGMLGLYASPADICARGINREMSEGKRYNRNLKQMQATFNQFVPVISAINGPFKIVHNARDQEPDVTLEGRGFAGSSVPQKLADDLAAITSSLE